MDTSKPRNDGKLFEGRTATALSLCGCEVTTEELVGIKKADLIAREVRRGREWRTAVECKDEGQRLSQKRLAELWVEYEAAWRSGEIHELLVVTRVPASAGAIAFAARNPGVSVQTLEELVRSALDLETYVQSLASAFDSLGEGVKRSYIAPKLPDESDLEDSILAWVEGKGESQFSAEKPIAILGAYGIGKTTLATHLASTLASQYLVNRVKRVPILIRLGEVATEQSLEGLLGAHFTATHRIRNYAFASFMEMNAAGHFVVILDGFDEMRQLMSWPEFRYNLGQLSRLVKNSARVILLGRPTAFQSDYEHHAVLRGSGSGDTEENESAIYHELTLRPFERNEIKEYVRSYLEYRGLAHAIPAVETQLRTKELRDIAKRPVQLRMLCDILPSYTGDVSRLDLPTVYDVFIDQLIDRIVQREEGKLNRLSFDAKTRRAFLQDLAWWMWSEREVGLTTTESIPLELVRPYAGALDLVKARRDLITGSPLDRHYGERITFAHRSFQEFLVAEEAWARLAAGTLSPAEFERHSTPEVALFASLLRDGQKVDVVRDLLRKQRGSLRWRTVNSLFLHTQVVEDIQREIGSVRAASRAAGRLSPWELLTAEVKQLEASSATRARMDPTHLANQVLVAENGGGHITLLGIFILSVLQARSKRQTDSYMSAINALIRSFSRQGSLEVVEANSATVRVGNGAYSSRNRRGEEFERELPQSPLQTKNLFLPLGQCIGDLRDNSPRIGRYIGSARIYVGKKGGLGIMGGSSASVRWVNPIEVQLAMAAEDSRVLDGGALGRTCVRHLQGHAFVEDWIGSDGSLARGLLLKDTQLQDDVAEALRDVAKGWRSYVASVPNAVV